MSSVKEANGQFNYAVEYDPAAVRIDQMLKAVSDLGYRPSVHGAIEASAAGQNVRVTVSGVTLERGKAGTLDVRLAPNEGKQLGEKSSIAVSSEALGVNVESSPEGKPRSVKVQVTVGEQAQPGDHELIVVVKSGADEVRVVVPVKVEAPAGGATPAPPKKQEEKRDKKRE